jgi:Zn finger protein HypA/HybF involved in hydrogenase expression
MILRNALTLRFLFNIFFYFPFILLKMNNIKTISCCWTCRHCEAFLKTDNNRWTDECPKCRRERLGTTRLFGRGFLYDC